MYLVTTVSRVCLGECYLKKGGRVTIKNSNKFSASEGRRGIGMQITDLTESKRCLDVNSTSESNSAAERKELPN